jgi:putative SOS response-associated peptidase YedK
MAEIHNRMPVILPVGVRDQWLDPGSEETELRSLLVPLPADDLEAYEVSTLVNSPRNDSPECVQPVVAGLEDEGRQRLLLIPTSRAGGGS